MATGSLALLLHQLPLRFRGLETIGKIVFLIDLTTFIFISAAMVARFAFTRRLLRKSLYDDREAFFFGAFWVSIALLIQNVASYGVPECGKWLVKVVEVVFWTYWTIVLVSSVGQYHALFVHRNLSIEKMTPMWLLPIYPLLVTGPLAGVVVGVVERERAQAVWVVGVASQGLGWMVAVFMYALWALRLLTEELPVRGRRAGMFIAVGPTGVFLFLYTTPCTFLYRDVILFAAKSTRLTRFSRLYPHGSALPRRIR